METFPNLRLISRKDAASKLDWSLPTLHRRMREDSDFPHPLKVKRCTKFLAAEIDDYIRRLIEVRDGGQAPTDTSHAIQARAARKARKSEAAK